MSLKRSDIRSVVLVITAISAATGSASAHDVWLTLSGDAASRRVVVNYGHPDDRPPAMPDKILDLLEIRSDGKASLLAGARPAQINGAFVVESQPFADNGQILLATRYDNGYWVKTKDGLYRNATRRLVPDAADSLWSSKFAKALTGADGPWRTVVGHDLEIVPLSDPAAIKPGQSLRLKVLFHGKPLPGAEVERGDGTTAVAEQDIARFVTDADGVASIPIVSAGPHLLVIDHKVVPSVVPEQANQDLFGATLWFSIVKGPGRSLDRVQR